MSILRVRDKDGNITDIAAIKGDQGKSAYQYALEGGYESTEQEFNQRLAADIYTKDEADAKFITAENMPDFDTTEIEGMINTHVEDKENPHEVTPSQIGAPTIAEMNAAIAAIPTPDVSGQINTHNVATDAHQDIRQAIPTKTSDLTNDSGFITEDTMPDIDVSGSINEHNNDSNAHATIRNSIPTKTSQLTNDSGFITANNIPAPDTSALENRITQLEGRVDSLTLSAVTVYSGATTPTNDIGADGDLYLVVE